MKQETKTKYTVTLKEVLTSLHISGDVVSCGINTRKEVSHPLDRELHIVVKKSKTSGVKHGRKGKKEKV